MGEREVFYASIAAYVVVIAMFLGTIVWLVK